MTFQIEYSVIIFMVVYRKLLPQVDSWSPPVLGFGKRSHSLPDVLYMGVSYSGKHAHEMLNSTQSINQSINQFTIGYQLAECIAYSLQENFALLRGFLEVDTI